MSRPRTEAGSGKVRVYASWCRGSAPSRRGGGLGATLRRYLGLPGTKSYLIHAGPGGSLGRVSHRPNLFLFTASAYKTFVLGQYLRDTEAGRLALGKPLAIDRVDLG
jgi:hypothetical protein